MDLVQLEQIESEWAIKAVRYARAEICPRYGPNDEPTPYEKGLIQRLAATYRDGYLAAVDALRAGAEAPETPADGEDYENACVQLEKIAAYASLQHPQKLIDADYALHQIAGHLQSVITDLRRAEAPATDTAKER